MAEYGKYCTVIRFERMIVVCVGMVGLSLTIGSVIEGRRYYTKVKTSLDE